MSFMGDDARNDVAANRNEGRRAFLRGVAGTALLPLLGGAGEETAHAQTVVTPGPGLPPAANAGGAPGLIIREKMPENLEFPFASLDSYLTPNDRFYVRSHFAVPTIDTATWRLKVEGAVRTPLDLTYADLTKMTAQTTTATLECAGNARVFLSPAVKGAQWGLGAVSNAEWTGVPLGAILERAGVTSSAVEVIFEGADMGEIKDPPKPTGAIHYARSLPLSRALLPGLLLAHRMNGEPLPTSHGFPLRLVVPGWYGMASVKWLTRIVVAEQPFNGYFQTIDYARWERPNGIPTRVPLGEMQIKSEIARPDMREVIKAGSMYRVFGAAWTGDSDIARVEISIDNGATWQTTQLMGAPKRHAWRFWEYNWAVPTQTGRYTLLSRATDGRGNVQPMQRQPDLENYVINYALPIDVDVK